MCVPLYTAGACGGIITTGETPSFLFSPGWPRKYRNFADCTWLIRAPESTVEFNILSLDIESHSSCNYDKLVIRDGEKPMLVLANSMKPSHRTAGNPQTVHQSQEPIPKLYSSLMLKRCSGYYEEQQHRVEGLEQGLTTFCCHGLELLTQPLPQATILCSSPSYPSRLPAFAL